MRKGSRIAVIIVFVIVVLFGVGQFFTAGIPNVATNHTATTSSAGTPPVPATQVIAYVPPAPASSTPVAQGSCWVNSIAAAARGDAWRCTTGNSINDPCFEVPNGTGTLLCGVNPTNPASTSTFILKLTKPLPQAQPVNDLPLQEQVWLVQLQDGTLCSPFTGTRPYDAAGDVANYGCAPGPLGKDVMIFGDLNTSSGQWTAEIGTLSAPTSTLPVLLSSSTIPVLAVWK